MWRNRFGSRWGRRPVMGRRSIIPYSFGGTLLAVSVGVLLLLYMLGYIG